MRLSLSDGNNENAFSYLKALVRKGTALNLLCPQEEGEGTIRAEIVVLEPDYLVDVTTVDACFETNSPKQQIITKLTPSDAAKAPILLGNFASQLLDESLHHPEAPLPYAESVRRFFEHNALDFAACPDPLADFHRQACLQRDNIRTLIRETESAVRNFEPKEALLEPTIFAEALGLQGRMDLLQSDLSVLVEQKSGKRDFHDTPRLTHKVQLQLYIAILHYAAGIPEPELAAFLLYSKYADGMMPQKADPALLRQAMEMRNHLVAQEIAMATEPSSAEAFFASTHADDLRCNPALSDKFWFSWKRPPIEHVLQAVRTATQPARSYFLRMFRFVSQEQFIGHVGDNSPQPTGMASLWKIPVKERREQGDLLWPLVICPITEDAEITTSTLHLRPLHADALTNSNFRTGDAVVFYAVAKDAEPDVRRTVAFRGSLESIKAEEIVLQLASPQSRDVAFSEDVTYAVEHDHVDTSRALFRSLLTFLTSSPERRDLILGLRLPTYDGKGKASGDYGEFQALVDGACRSRDLYLVVGPPGTGKTSFGMLNILREALLNPAERILLTAYTNRAVDEICQKLLEAGIPFLRLGRPTACSPQSRHALLSSLVSKLPRIEELRTEILSARVVVGTTTTLANNPQLFALRSFGLCIVDEASQILEPQLMPLLTAQHDGHVAIGRFVLIGDHKQLPAVVSQNADDSRVEESDLHAIGLENCRHSFFQRMLGYLRAHRPECIYEMTRQGRMHPDVADFPNRMFYAGHLKSAGLPHQKATLCLEKESSTLQDLTASRRMLFFDMPKPSECTAKTNASEAAFIAHLALLVWRRFQAEGRAFSPDSSLGIIVPYRGQIMCIRNFLAKEISGCLPESEQAKAEALLHVNIDTVERYQGSQRDIIIYGFTVSNTKQLDFLTAEYITEKAAEGTADEVTIDRKLNVALTRAREQLFIVGNAPLLSGGEVFQELIRYAQEHDAFFPADRFRPQGIIS